ncbi:unnamed protein product, partial [Allacma fusca]
MTSKFLECVTLAATDRKKVCIGWSIQIKSLVAKNLTLHGSFSPVLVAKLPAITTFLHAVTQKNSKFMYFLNHITAWIRDTGLNHKWFQDVLHFRRSNGAKWLEAHKKSDLYLKLAAAVSETHESKVK